MREITIQEMTLVSGAADDGKGGSTSRDFRTALITLAVEKIYKIIESQIDYYVRKRLIIWSCLRGDSCSYVYGQYV
ncbi:hypothetical protein KTH46_05560 [Acinetobacter bereziniae]|jgi:hypothetical protein|uniref:hypothetical protein n=1 Tax=Acinetobacter bereziniae TaxID=106648 RepID=UPI0021D10C46|nr:hypothetical protein [Acinetobacter bereziniae]MCU4314487.1 hypothetical protein [Acinetobacter bereziniae]